MTAFSWHCKRPMLTSIQSEPCFRALVPTRQTTGIDLKAEFSLSRRKLLRLFNVAAFEWVEEAGHTTWMR